MRHGFRSALLVQFGSLVGDAVWAVLGLAGVGALMMVDGIRVPLTVAGALLTAGLGMRTVLDAVRASRTRDAMADLGPESPPSASQSLVVGAALSLTSPANLVFWGGAAAAVSGALASDATWTSLVVFFCGFFTASLLWCWCCAGFIALVRRAASARAVRTIEATCGGALVALGGTLLLSL